MRRRRGEEQSSVRTSVELLAEAGARKLEPSSRGQRFAVWLLSQSQELAGNSHKHLARAAEEMLRSSKSTGRYCRVCAREQRRRAT